MYSSRSSTGIDRLLPSVRGCPRIIPAAHALCTRWRWVRTRALQAIEGRALPNPRTRATLEVALNVTFELKSLGPCPGGVIMSRIWPRIGVLSLLALCAFMAGPAHAQEKKTIGIIERKDPRLDRIVPEGAVIEKLAEGFDWAEGPVWQRRSGVLLFSD